MQLVEVFITPVIRCDHLFAAPAVFWSRSGFWQASPGPSQALQASGQPPHSQLIGGAEAEPACWSEGVPAEAHRPGRDQTLAMPMGPIDWPIKVGLDVVPWRG